MSHRVNKVAPLERISSLADEKKLDKRKLDEKELDERKLDGKELDGVADLPDDVLADLVSVWFGIVDTSKP